jgi:acyl carrier protein
MERAAIRQEIALHLAEILDEDKIALEDDTTAAMVDGWDSVNHVKLIIALESSLKIRFDADEITAPENVGALIDLITQKLQKQRPEAVS